MARMFSRIRRRRVGPWKKERPAEFIASGNTTDLESAGVRGGPIREQSVVSTAQEASHQSVARAAAATALVQPIPTRHRRPAGKGGPTAPSTKKLRSNIDQGQAAVLDLLLSHQGNSGSECTI